jgi:hypothetical protein
MPVDERLELLDNVPRDTVNRTEEERDVRRGPFGRMVLQRDVADADVAIVPQMAP